MCGARSVVFYDREPLALQCCLLSAEANGLTVTGCGGSEGGYVVSKPAMGAAVGAGAVAEEGAGVAAGAAAGAVAAGGVAGGVAGLPALCSAEVFDWNSVPADQAKFDLVLACDVLYEVGGRACSYKSVCFCFE
jgi:hypothetical protein